MTGCSPAAYLALPDEAHLDLQRRMHTVAMAMGVPPIDDLTTDMFLHDLDCPGRTSNDDLAKDLIKPPRLTTDLGE